MNKELNEKAFLKINTRQCLKENSDHMFIFKMYIPWHENEKCMLNKLGTTNGKKKPNMLRIIVFHLRILVVPFL